MAAWFLGKGSGCRGSRLVPTSANGCAAFGSYQPDPDGRPRAVGDSRSSRCQATGSSGTTTSSTPTSSPRSASPHTSSRVDEDVGQAGEVEQLDEGGAGVADAERATKPTARPPAAARELVDVVDVRPAPALERPARHLVIAADQHEGRVRDRLLHGAWTTCPCKTHRRCTRSLAAFRRASGQAPASTWPGSSRRTGSVRVIASDALAITPGGGRVGSLVSGALDAQLADVAGRLGDRGRLVEAHVGDTDALIAGLSCGGDARCLLVPGERLPAELWDLLLAARARLPDDAPRR